MRQYLSVKEKYQDAILFYRLGDFYEMFFDDALKASRLLDLTLTSRNKNQENAVALCGVPAHSALSYINKLIGLGEKVAICEQMEDPKTAKGIVKREVVRVFTPGAVLDPDCLEGKTANHLVAITQDQGRLGLAIADVSTGSFKCFEFDDASKMLDELARLEAREMLIDAAEEGLSWVLELKSRFSAVRINALPGWHFDADFGRELFEKYYQTRMEGLGLVGWDLAARSGGALLSYLNDNKLLKEGLLSRPQMEFFSHTLALDDSAKRNLELIKTLADGKTQGSLLWVLDQAQTAMGSRKIKEWLLFPLLSREGILARHEAVGELVRQTAFSQNLGSLMAGMADLERLINRVLAEIATPRDVKALADSLEKVPLLKGNLFPAAARLLKQIQGELVDFQGLTVRIKSTLLDEPGLSYKDGGIIRDGVHPTLDELRDIERNGKSTIATLENAERESTGIGSLKIRFNRVFGYYIEITHLHREKIPAHYIRKQTLANVERYITPELKEYEDKVLRSGERIRELESQIFLELRSSIAALTAPLKQTAQALAHLDALLSLGLVARENRYVCPEIVEEPVLSIVGGRHPVVEKIHFEEPFVPNDLELDARGERILLITGPNMAGKSTVMRQTALICIMAQMGSFVPAASARVGIVDRVFTRIGASDHLLKGQSTFMVEMLETAYILNQATNRSLILLDEIGRGTSTFDGLSIAWAVAETLHDQIQARTLFATHYHELTDLADEKKGIRNMQMAVKEWNGQVRFLRQLKPGAINRSYGVAVAASAGLPPPTVRRAREILKILEEKDLAFESQVLRGPHQPSLFEAGESAVEKKLREVDINELTPLGALNWVAALKKELES